MHRSFQQLSQKHMLALYFKADQCKSAECVPFAGSFAGCLQNPTTIEVRHGLVRMKGFRAVRCESSGDRRSAVAACSDQTDALDGFARDCMP